MQLNLLHLSDLHYRPNWHEEIGLILSSFKKDLPAQLPDDGQTYAVFSGDFVLAGADSKLFATFASEFDEILSSNGLTREKRIVVPGNHDIARSTVEDTVKIAQGALGALKSEEDFLNQLKNLNRAFFEKKFVQYIAFESNFAHYSCCQKNLGGQGWEITKDIGVYCLNTALCSFAGVEEGGSGKKIDDRGILSIDTRNIYQWEQNTSAKFRILVMHHPIDWLSEWARIELEKVIATSFHLVLFGHFHLGYSKFSTTGQNGHLMNMAPPLFTRKKEKVGYSIISTNIETGETLVKYRDWSQHNKFVSGTVTSGTENGTILYNLSQNTPALPVEGVNPIFLSSQDSARNSKLSTENILEIEFHEVSMCYSSKRQLWVDRDLSRHPESINSKELKDSSPPESIINSPRNCILRAPEGFGLSAYARHVALHHHRQTGNKKTLVIIDIEEVPNYKRGTLDHFSMRCHHLGIVRTDIAGIIIDHWTGSQSDVRILRYLNEEYPNLPAMIFQSFSQFLDINGLVAAKDTPQFELIYLRSLSRSRIRELARLYIGEAALNLDEEIVTKKLIDDIDSLNMHRTPLNCLLILKAIEREFDESPVNRTQMISNVLNNMFYQFDKIPKYSTRPDIKDCEFALGYLCEWLIRANRRTLSKIEFLHKINEYLKKQLMSLDVEVLFNFLFSERILISRGTDFGFRHGYWFCYFVAQRMHHNRAFAEFIFEDLRYSAFPEVIEFYTGIDRMRDDALAVLDRDLKKLDNEFLLRTNLSANFDPFSIAEWNPNEAAVENMQAEVVESIRESTLPDEVKDAVADGTYDCSKPYHQEVSQFITKSSLAQMVQAMRGAARALRNCDHASPELRERLLRSVITCWVRMCQTLAMLSPVLASKHQAECDGMGFILSDEFGRDDAPDKLWKEIMEAITDNVINWYQSDLFSKKLVPLLESYLSKHKGGIEEFFLVYILVVQRPIGWEKVAQHFVMSSPKNSFYLYKVYSIAKYEFRLGFAKENVRQQLRRTAAIAVARHQTKSKRPNNDLIEKAAATFDCEISTSEAVKNHGDDD